MKKILPLLLFVLSPILCFSQRGKMDDLKVREKATIGSSSFDKSAVLTITSTDKGILIPRMTAIERNAISNPATGLLVFDTDSNTFLYFDSSVWVKIAKNAGAIIDDSSSVTYSLDTLKALNNPDIQVRDSITFNQHLKTANTVTIKALSGGGQLNLREGADNNISLLANSASAVGGFGQGWFFADQNTSGQGFGDPSLNNNAQVVASSGKIRNSVNALTMITIARATTTAVANIGLFQNEAVVGTNGDRVLSISSASAVTPTTSPANIVQLWAEDISGGGTTGLNIMGESGAIVQIDGNITIPDTKVIKAENGGSELDLRNGGTNDNIALTTDNGNFLEGFVFLDPTLSQIGFGLNTLITLSNTGTSIDGSLAIGTAIPATSAKLEISSTTGAVLFPRMTTAQRNALTAVNGMVIYNTSLDKLQVRAGGSWISLH